MFLGLGFVDFVPDWFGGRSCRRDVTTDLQRDIGT